MEIRHYDVTADVSAEYDQEILAAKVEGFNDRNSFLLFDAMDGDNSIRFLLAVKISIKKKDFSEICADVSALFDCQPAISPLSSSHMTPLLVRKLAVMKKAMHHTIMRGEERSRWSSKSIEQVIDDAAQIPGFSAFRQGMDRLRRYCGNVQRSGGRGNYNVLIVNECGVDCVPFVDCLFDLLTAENVIYDPRIVTGDLGDAYRTKCDTPLMYCVAEEWGGEFRHRFETATERDAILLDLQKRASIYITVMTKEQFGEMRDNEHFHKLFPHVLFLVEPTREEKKIWLSNEAKIYGFSMAETGAFEHIALLNMPISAIQSAVSRVVSEKMSEAAMDTFVLYPEDFLFQKETIKKIDPIEELHAMIGLDAVKKQLDVILRFLQRRGKDALPCLHMAFRGNPGTGKTTVARLIGRIFADAGILPKGECFVETDREGLVGRYVGHTAVKTATKIEDAMGGVLFIDEAYSLGMYESGNDFGSEALATLVKRMEDRRKDFVCIMAGYTDEMDTMLSKNPGLHDRIQFYIDFPDYSTQELVSIFEQFCEQGDYVLCPAARFSLAGYFEQVEQNKPEHFANARLARKIFERVQMQQVMRTEERDIQREDIEAVFSSDDMTSLIAVQSRCAIGFAC